MIWFFVKIAFLFFLNFSIFFFRLHIWYSINWICTLLTKYFHCLMIVPWKWKTNHYLIWYHKCPSGILNFLIFILGKVKKKLFKNWTFWWIQKKHKHNFLKDLIWKWSMYWLLWLFVSIKWFDYEFADDNHWNDQERVARKTKVYH